MPQNHVLNKIASPFLLSSFCQVVIRKKLTGDSIEGKGLGRNAEARVPKSCFYILAKILRKEPKRECQNKWHKITFIDRVPYFTFVQQNQDFKINAKNMVKFIVTLCYCLERAEQRYRRIKWLLKYQVFLCFCTF